ncbi:MAG: flagellar export chaperone FliS [Thermoguttaceae bacterium]
MSSQQPSVRQTYIQGDLYSATPQKIQLLLVEAAIKNIHRCKLFWKEARFEEALEASQRAQDIVAEMLCALDLENAPEIARQLASIYLFIFRKIAESGMLYSEEKLNDALRVLESERETWRLACEKFGSTKTAAGDTRVATSTPTKTAIAASAGLDLSAAATKTAVSPAAKRPIAPTSTASKAKSGWDA